jgi:hypothetical protein
MPSHKLLTIIIRVMVLYRKRDQSFLRSLPIATTSNLTNDHNFVIRRFVNYMPSHKLLTITIRVKVQDAKVIKYF